jgi:hypothetical protein
MSVAMLTALPRRQMSDHQEQMHEQLEQIRVALHQMASEAQGPQPPRPEPRSAADNSFLISERQEWTFGETLEYALDALELALAKMATD